MYENVMLPLRLILFFIINWKMGIKKERQKHPMNIGCVYLAQKSTPITFCHRFCLCQRPTPSDANGTDIIQPAVGTKGLKYWYRHLCQMSRWFFRYRIWIWIPYMDDGYKYNLINISAGYPISDILFRYTDTMTMQTCIWTIDNLHLDV